MGGSSAIFFLIALFAFFTTVYGVFAKKRSPPVGIIASIAAIMSVGGAFYAWTESHSLPWTIGYCLVAAVAAYSAARHFFRPETKTE